MNDDLPEYPEDQLEALRGAAKEELRRRVAALRRALKSETRAAFSRSATHHLVESEIFHCAKVVALYEPLRFEVDIRAVAQRACAEGKTLGLPRVVAHMGTMELARYAPGDPLIESAFMVKEPAQSAPALDLSEVDLVLVPGLAFDPRGYRLGFGQGFYDRLLPRLPNAVRVGVAFELQLLAEVPAQAHDEPVDFLATERRMLRCER